MGGKQPFDGFEFEIGTESASTAGSGSIDDDLDGDDDLELELSLFGLPPPVEEQTVSPSASNSNIKSSSPSSSSASLSTPPSTSSSAPPSTVHPDDISNGSPRSMIDLSLPPGSGPRRTLLGEYGDSLRWVNRLYTREFGKETRKAPAHMPHMIDVAIENELQGRWPELFDDTSSHRFRHSHDMQYSFSYFYYLMNVPPRFRLPSGLEGAVGFEWGWSAG